MRRSFQFPDGVRVSLTSTELHPRLKVHVEGVPSRRLLRLTQAVRVSGDTGPVAVRPIAGEPVGRYQVLVGALHFQASIQAKARSIRVLVCDGLEIDHVLLGLTRAAADPQRNPIAMANLLQAFTDLIPIARHEDLAALTGLSRSVITHALLLNRLPARVKRHLETGQLSFGHGAALCSDTLLGAPERQIELATEALKHKWSVKALRRVVSGRPRDVGTPAERARPLRTPGTPVVDPNITRLEERLRESTGLPTHIEHQTSGQGTVRFTYHSLDELDNLLRLLPLEVH